MLAQAGSPGRRGAVGALVGRPGEWLFELKLDGLRVVAVRNGEEEVKLFSRNRLSFDARFPGIADALRALPATDFVIDGEVVALVGGRPDFSALQQSRVVPTEYWVFDLLWVLGEDVRHLAIEQRKALLAKTLRDGPRLKVVRALQGEPWQLFEQACEQGWEGLMAKRAGSPYRKGRSGDWLKLKCGCRQELVVGGFTEPRGTRGGFGALLLGYWEGGELVYAGKVGTGFTQASLADLSQRLAAVQRMSCPFAGQLAPAGAAAGRAVHWVEPLLVAEVAFTGWTPEGRLRHPSFLGLRADKPSREVVREGCGPRAGRR
jgi:bifunctional non-homologous end joining protein LigD